MTSITTIAMMGKPGSGKGTQAKLLAETLNYDFFSSGGAFRALREEDTFLGKKVKGEYDQGLLMPHWFASYWFEHKAFHTPHDTGIVFEGPGRKLPEAELFCEVMEWLDRPYRAIYLDVDEDKIIERLQIRAKKEGRSDDDPEAIKKRFEEYNTHTAASVKHFKDKGKLIEINGMQTPEQVHEDIMTELKKL